MNDTTKKILILAAVFAAIFLIAKRQGKDGFKSKPRDIYDGIPTNDKYGMPVARPSMGWDYREDIPSVWQN